MAMRLRSRAATAEGLQYPSPTLLLALALVTLLSGCSAQSSPSAKVSASASSVSASDMAHSFWADGAWHNMTATPGHVPALSHRRVVAINNRIRKRRAFKRFALLPSLKPMAQRQQRMIHSVTAHQETLNNSSPIEPIMVSIARLIQDHGCTKHALPVLT